MRENLRGHLEALSKPRNPTRHPAAHRAAAEHILSALQQFGRPAQRQTFHREGREGINLLSPVQEKASPSFLVVAHYDTVDHSPGADDNGSAVAVALELARLHPEAAILFPDLEEFGLLGSRHFVSTGLWKDIPALVLESVGYWNDQPGSQGYPELLPAAFPEQFDQLRRRDFRGDFLVLLHRSGDSSQAQQLRQSLTGDLICFELADGLLQSPQGAQLRDFGRSDHLAFWERNRCCLMLTDSANFRNPNYHLPTDTLSTLDLDRMALLTGDLSRFLTSLK